MPLKSDFSGFLAGLFPEAGPALVELYASAADNAGLLRTDFYTIRDLLDLSGYATEEPLHVLLLCLVLALDEGSLCVEATEAGLARRLAYLGEVGELAREAATALAADRYPRLIGRDVDSAKPVVLRRHAGRVHLYFQKYLRHELVLHEQLRRRIGGPDTPVWPARQECLAHQAPALRTVFHEVVQDQPFRLNRDQRLAVALALLRSFAIVSGGPGTGKTSIVFSLLRCLVRAGIRPERIALAAPTGRAAQRLTDAIRAGLANLGAAPAGPDAALAPLAATTLHHLLGFHPSRGTFRHHIENPLLADVVIVDEVSMVGLVLMAQLLQATDPATKLVLLGDKDQLPSVEAGAVLANLAPADSTPSYSATLRSQIAALDPELVFPQESAPQPLQDVLVVLEENYRSQRDIQEIAAAVNRQEAAVIDRLARLAFPPHPNPLPQGERESRGIFPPLESKPGCWFLDLAGMSLGGWRRLLEGWLEHHYLASDEAKATYRGLVETCVLPTNGAIPPAEQALLDQLFAVLGRARVLTLIREGPWGCVGINQFLADLLRPRLDRGGRSKLFLGAPVLMTRNDHARGLFNGDVGITLRDAGGGYRVVFSRQGGYLSCPAETLPGHELAFALTVHKSQGSEYGQVLLVLPPEGGKRLLTKEMVYTGITRARELVVICAATDVLRFAIGRRIERESALLLGEPGASATGGSSR
jgi:exodeoxyribonuclease V alpha subunit